MQKFFLILFCNISCLPLLRSQNSVNDSIFHHPPNKNAVAFYFKTLGEDAPLYNGSEYASSWQNIAGSPFFGSDSVQKATIVYGSTVYHDIPALYDLVNDEIIIKDNRGNYFIKLVKEKVSSFNLSGHDFIRLGADSSTGFQVEPGFYDRIYKGDISAFAKRRRSIGYTTDEEKINYTILSKTTYYILKADGWFKITGRASLVAAFRNEKSDVQQFYRDNHLNFKKEPENTLIKLISYYESLKK